jgi:protein transport protein SEC61 subunit gamma-like protein
MAEERPKTDGDEQTEFLADETEPLVPEEPQKDDEVGPDFSDEKPVAAKQKDEVSQKLKEEPKQVGAPIPGKLDKLKTFIVECKRVLRVTKKPNKEEFQTIVKVSAIGMGIIGVLGFLVHFIKEIFF